MIRFYVKEKKSVEMRNQFLLRLIVTLYDWMVSERLSNKDFVCSSQEIGSSVFCRLSVIKMCSAFVAVISWQSTLRGIKTLVVREKKNYEVTFVH